MGVVGEYVGVDRGISTRHVRAGANQLPHEVGRRVCRVVGDGYDRGDVGRTCFAYAVA